MTPGGRANAPPTGSATTAAAPEGATGGRIVVDGVHKHFFHDDRAVVALRDVSLSVAAGEFVSVIGPSGCGKSTLLRVIGGLVAPDGGSVRIDDATPDEAPSAKRFGFVPQTPALLPWRSVLGNVTLLRDVGRRRGRTRGDATPAPPEDRGRDAMALLEKVGLARFARKSLPRELSGGMQQRVSLRAFALAPPILLMDEPFAALDEFTRDAMRYQLLDIGKPDEDDRRLRHPLHLGGGHPVRPGDHDGRPAGPCGLVEVITLPRPRSEDMEDSDLFTTHAHRVRTALRASWEGRT